MKFISPYYTCEAFPFCSCSKTKIQSGLKYRKIVFCKEEEELKKRLLPTKTTINGKVWGDEE